MSIANRRAIHPETDWRSATVPGLGGDPRSAPELDRAAITAGGGGSHGVPIERSTRPPSNASPNGLKRSIRSYGYGGGTKPVRCAIPSECCATARMLSRGDLAARGHESRQPP